MKKVLVVEDQALNLDLLVQLLEDDYEVLTATDGAMGIDLAERERPDLILMDLSLPVVDGWEATCRIKGDDRLKHIPIIALTAHAMKGDEERARLCGCDDYVTKPLDEDLLFAKLDHFLGG
jgi:CheY-like chemotaxis protein